MISGLRGYNSMVRVEESGGRKVNRARWDGEKERRYKKMAAKTSWYRKKKRKGGNSWVKGNGEKKRGKEEESDIEAVLFVPHTPGGLLAKLLQEEDDRFRRGTEMKRIKMVERGGKSIKEIFATTNPWARDGCSREDCLPCMGERGRGGDCQKENICYRVFCLECGLANVKAEYTGESSRTSYLRGREHLEGLARRSDKNALWKHCVECHGGREVQFRMKVLRGHRSPLTRQIQEGVEIENSQADIIMNSKGEWNGSRLPRIVIEVGDEIQEDGVECGETETENPRIKIKARRGGKRENESKRSEENPPLKRRRKSGPDSTKPECGTMVIRENKPDRTRRLPECGPSQPESQCTAMTAQIRKRRKKTQWI